MPSPGRAGPEPRAHPGGHGCPTLATSATLRGDRGPAMAAPMPWGLATHSGGLSVPVGIGATSRQAGGSAYESPGTVSQLFRTDMGDPFNSLSEHKHRLARRRLVMRELTSGGSLRSFPELFFAGPTVCPCCLSGSRILTRFLQCLSSRFSLLQVTDT